MLTQDNYRGHAPVDQVAAAHAAIDRLKAFAKSPDSGSLAKSIEEAHPLDAIAKMTATLDKIDAMIDRKVDEAIDKLRKAQDK